MDIEEKIKDIKDRVSKSNRYVLYADKTDIDFLLKVIEMQQKQLDDITEDDLPFSYFIFYNFYAIIVKNKGA